MSLEDLQTEMNNSLMILHRHLKTNYPDENI